VGSFPGAQLLIEDDQPILGTGQLSDADCVAPKGCLHLLLLEQLYNGVDLVSRRATRCFVGGSENDVAD
jgi:hypothetical protein